MLVTLGRGMSSGMRKNTPAATITAENLLNLSRWYDASDESSISDSGGTVTQWADKSGNAGHATAVSTPETGTRTINGRNAIDFDGSADHFTMASIGLSAYTKIVAFEVDSLTAGNNTISNVGGNDALWMDSKASMSVFLGDASVGSRIITGNTALTTGSTIIAVSTCDANGATYLWVNGVFQGMGERPKGGSETPYLGRYGGGNYLNGAMGEAALYSRVLDVSEINQLCASWASKWGGTWADIQDESISALRVASLHNRGATARQTNAGTNTIQAYRWATLIAQDCSDLVISCNNWYGNNSNVEELTGNDIEITDMALENEAGTVVVPVYFGGSRSITLINGTSNIQSDAIDPASFSLAQFTKGEKYFLKGKITVSSAAHYIPYTQRYYGDNSSEDQVVTFDPGSTTCSSTDTAGKYTQTGTAFTVKNNGYQPIVLGTPLDSTVPAYIIVGDSIADYANDNSTAGLGGRAFGLRAMHDAGAVTNPIPALNVARYGSASNLAYYGGKWKAFIKYTNRAIEEYGTNDIGTGTPPTLTDVEDRIVEIWASLKRNGVSKIIRTKLLPRTTSTDSWQTEANQTYQTNWGVGESADLLNDWLETKLADASIEALTEGTTARGTDPLKWVVDGSSSYATSDGTHPGATVHEFLAVEIRGLIAILEVFPAIPLVWYDASDTSTITETAGAVSQIDDKTGHGHHATASGSEPTTGIRTINGLNVLDFDGSNDYLDLPSSLYGVPNADYTAFFVHEKDITVLDRSLLRFTSAGSNVMILGAGNATSRVARLANGTAFADLSGTLDTNTHIICGKWDGTTLSVFRDGGTPATRTTSVANFTANGGFLMDNANKENGAMGEVVVFNQALSVSQINQVGQALASKWGTTWTDMV